MTGSRSVDRLEGKSKGFRHITPCGTVPFSCKINLDCSEFAVRDQELPRPLPPAEEKKRMEGVSREKIAEERMAEKTGWDSRYQDAYGNKIWTMLYPAAQIMSDPVAQIMSDPTDQYVLRAKRDE